MLLTSDSWSYTLYTNFMFYLLVISAVAVFVITDLFTFRTEFVGVFRTYLYAQFHIPRSNGSLVVAIIL